LLPPFLTFLTQELLPRLRRLYAVTIDPEQTIVAGSSYGGLAAAFAGLSAPTIFGNVLSQSGAFWWSPEGEEEPEWLTRHYATRERLPLRWYLDVGFLEEEPGYRMVTVTRHLRDVLQAKGYPVQYAEVSGGHEYLSWRGTLAEGLLALMGQKQMGAGDEDGQRNE
jgi:enterochelin esterase-like enzyme